MIPRIPLTAHLRRRSRAAYRLIALILLAAQIAMPMPVSPRTPSTPNYDPTVLSYGLYWFGVDNANQKFVHGEVNPYFDPTKPTLIFVHGWQPNLSALYPPNFIYNNSYDCASNTGFVNTANAWVSGGWNVGIFYWNQFSDEPNNVQWAEAKIWTANGPQRMRWRKGGVTYEEAPAGTPSAAELLYQTYVAAMTEYDYAGGNIRIAGHSLGNQLAVRLTQLVNEGIEAGTVPTDLRPTRVALLDPYWSLGAKDYLGGKTTGQAIREQVVELTPTGTLFEWYWSSSLTVSPNGDTNAALKPMMLYAALTPAYVSDATNMRQHCAAYHLYFWSYAFDGPATCTGEACLAMSRLLSKMTDTQLAAVTRSDYAWSQTGGAATATPDDDLHQSSLRSSAPFTVTQLIAEPVTATVGIQTVTLTATVVDKNNAPANDGILVTFSTDLGAISARAVTRGGVAMAHLTSAVTGTAHISATTRGADGIVHSSATVTFADGKYSLYLPVVLRN